MADLGQLVHAVMPRGPSDVHLRPGRHPILRVKGRLVQLGDWPLLKLADIETMARQVMSRDQWRRLAQTGGVNMPLVLPGLGRFRLTICQARGLPTIALRVLFQEIPTLDELKLPPVLGRLAMERRGLVLLTGPTGSGKTTTMAAMINLMTLHRSDHIVMIEDPIEYIYESRRCVITQRELGLDVRNYGDALRLALRQDPNVVVVGEMRDPDTFRAVMTLAQTGHLVLTTVHAGTAVEAIHRIISVVPEHEEMSIRNQLAHVLKGIVSQRLVERADGSGLIPATEIMITTSSIVRAILEPHLTRQIPNIIARGRDLFGTQTFDQCVLDYFLRGIITEATALRACNSPIDFDVQLRRMRKEHHIEQAGAQPPPARTQKEAILVLEVVDMTKILVTHGDAAFGAFADRMEEQLQAIVKRFRSRVLERHLDGFLITFPNVDWAILALRDIFNRLSEFNQLAELEVAFRGALHYGMTWVDPHSSRVGAAVHKTFRVCAAIDTPDLWEIVRPREKNVVVATAEARDMLIPYNVSSRPLGGVPLKGFLGTHELYELNITPP